MNFVYLPLSIADLSVAIRQYVVAPIAAFGLGGFVFTVQGESHATLSSETTDHYTEDNSAVQDHIAIRPKRITLKGYVGELNFYGAGDSPTVLQKLAQKLVQVNSYLPALSSAAQQLQSALNGSDDVSFSSALNTGSNLYGVVKNSLGANGDQAKQQDAYNYFRGLMEAKVMIGVQTPWEFMTNMVIEHITAIQPEETKFITDFSITLKQLRIVQIGTVAFSLGGITSKDLAPLSRAEISAVQGSETISQGPNSGSPVFPDSFKDSSQLAGTPAFSSYIG